MKFRTKFRTVELNLPKEVAAIEKVLEQANLTAASLWLGVVTSIVPVWSSASHATFAKLASAVGFTLRPVAKPSAPDRYVLGFLSSQGGLQKARPGSHRFFYSTKLSYLAFNNDNIAVPGVGGVRWGLKAPTPYKFVEAGQNTFENFAKTVRLPNPVYTTRSI